MQPDNTQGLGLRNHQQLRVEYQTFAVMPDGKEVALRAPHHNLTLDQGMNAKADTSWYELFKYCAIGSSTNPVTRDSGATTFSRAGTTVTASANFFEAGDVGRLFKFDSGEECYVSTYTDAQHVTVSIGGTVAATPGTIWYVNDTGHGAELKRTGTLVTGAGDCQTTYNGATGEYTLKRTFLFTAETGAVTYNEIGWSSNSAAGANLTGRDVISGGDSLGAGQAYKVIVRFIIAVTPIVSTAVGNVGTGCDTTGNAAIETTDVDGGPLYPVRSDGSTFSRAGLEYDPGKGSMVCKLIGATFTLTPNGGVVSHSSLQLKNSPAAAAYVTGSFQRKVTWTFGQTEGNGTIYGITTWGDSGNDVYTLKLTTPFTKTSDQTLAVDLTMTWGRVLLNT